jgi:hypothetical protein
MTQLAGNPRDVESVLFSRTARRFERTDVDAWSAADGSRAYSATGGSDLVLR